MPKWKPSRGIAPPKNKRKLRQFIDMADCYRDMWINRSYVLVSLAKLTSKKIDMGSTDLENGSIQKIRTSLPKRPLLAYPDFNRPFEIHTDASYT
jgi:hypothetical protein